MIGGRAWGVFVGAIIGVVLCALAVGGVFLYQGDSILRSHNQELAAITTLSRHDRDYEVASLEVLSQEIILLDKVCAATPGCTAQLPHITVHIKGTKVYVTTKTTPKK
jgi:uncharacterized membrane protein YdfJ with MMPL/SSD domain